MDQQNDLFDELLVDKSITTEMLDRKVEVMVKAKTDYDSLKAQSTECYKVYEELKAQLISMLQAANKKKYHVDGIGTASVVEKLKVKTPSDLAQKELFLDWLKGRFGNDANTFLNVNYNTLNKLYNDEFESAINEGNADTFEIPGLDKPVAEYSLSFRK